MVIIIAIFLKIILTQILLKVKKQKIKKKIIKDDNDDLEHKKEGEQDKKYKIEDLKDSENKNLIKKKEKKFNKRKKDKI